MDINKENTKYLAYLLANCGATQDEINDLSFDDEVGFFESNRLADWFVSQINFGWRVWQAAKAQAAPEGFVLVSAEQMSQWGHMASYAEQYGCPECFEARGYAHGLACEINEFFAIEPQEPVND